MLSDQFKEKAQYEYFRALTHIRDGKEVLASVALHVARETVLNGKFFTDLQDSDLQQIAPELTVNNFHALYGDQDYRYKSQWVPQCLMPMVNDHFTQFESQFGNVRGENGQILSWEKYNERDNEASSPAPDFNVA